MSLPDGFSRLLPVAQGGMGYVELVLRREGRFRRVYAVKRLQPQLREDPAFRAMFMDEARLSGLVRHPNVVSVLDVGEDADGPYLLMEYVEGVSLATLIEKAEPRADLLPVPLCASVAAQVARGLHAAHETTVDGRPLGLVHRDVSPPNILVGHDGVARVTDFGIAKALGNLNRTSTGLLKGNVGYMSPELLRFEAPDRRSDLFSLGVVLYEMLARRRLYSGPEVSAVARRILEEPQPDIGELRDDVTPPLGELLFELLAKDREARPTDARATAERLEDALGDYERLDVASWMEERFAASRAEQGRTIEEAIQRAEAGAGPRRWRRPAALGAAALAVAAVVVGLARRPSTVALPEALGLAAGSWHTCAERRDGIYCWGKNTDGQLGDDQSLDQTVARLVRNLDGRGRIVSLDGGAFHTCAVTDRHDLLCWGRNDRGQLGVPDLPGSRVPRPLPGMDGAVAVTAGHSHACARHAGGAVSCWGSNTHGQLGAGVSGEAPGAPARVTGLPPVAEVRAGGDVTCARTAEGAVWCWGANGDGQLGDGTQRSSSVPVAVQGLRDARQIAVGGEASCALRAGGTVECWGSNVNGRLGDGGPAASRPRPGPVVDLAGVAQVEVALHFSCARLAGGEVRCWGWSHWGNLGVGVDGPNERRDRPVAVRQVRDAVGLALGNQHACVRHSSEAISCWGDNPSGQLGDGTRQRRLEPVSVSGFP
jgi:serine/threonine-protein kinase